MKKLRIKLKTLMLFAGWMAWSFFAGGVVHFIAEGYGWSEVLELTVCFIVVFGGLAVYNLLKRLIVIEVS